MVVLVSNNYKLVIIVLSFFLALTFVRGFGVETSTHTITLSGSTPTAYPIILSNSSDSTEYFQVQSLGPFSIEVAGGNDSLSIPSHSKKTITLYLTPQPPILEGQTYRSLLRVVGTDSSKDIELDIQYVASTVPLTNPNPVSGVFSGLVAFPIASEWVVDAVLVILIMVLLVALWARIKNRVVG